MWRSEKDGVVNLGVEVLVVVVTSFLVWSPGVCLVGHYMLSVREILGFFVYILHSLLSKLSADWQV